MMTLAKVFGSIARAEIPNASDIFSMLEGEGRNDRRCSTNPLGPEDELVVHHAVRTLVVTNQESMFFFLVKESFLHVVPAYQYARF